MSFTWRLYGCLVTLILYLPTMSLCVGDVFDEDDENSTGNIAFATTALNAGADPAPLTKLKNLEGVVEKEAHQKIPALRAKAIRAAGRSAGAQNGLYWRSNQLIKQLVQMEKYLDEIYNVALESLMIRYRDFYIVPPVISGTEGGMRKSDNGRVLRIAEHTFRIERDPYFLINPPTWRDYLSINVPKPDPVVKALMPRNQEEYEIWLEGVNIGWKAGVHQADMIMRTHLARMTRDIVGMVRYHMLKRKRMVSPPQVTEKYLPVSGGGRQMSIEDSIIKIVSDPELNANRNKWVPLPELPDARKIFPSVYYEYRGTTYD